jgi:hypothetical protein
VIKRQRTAVILSSFLTDGSARVVAWNDANNADVRHDTVLAIGESTLPQAKSILGSLDDKPVRQRPVATMTGRTIGATYHHGERYETYVVGSAAQITAYCEMTDNEREQLQHKARRATTEGKFMLVVGRSLDHHSTRTIKDIPEGSMEYRGSLTLQPQLFTNTVARIEKIKTQYEVVVYLSSDPEHLVASTATAAHIIRKADTLMTTYHLPLDDGSYAVVIPTDKYSDAIAHFSYADLYDKP